MEADDARRGVVEIESDKLCEGGYRSQKDLCLVSQSDVWPLVDGFLGNDSAVAQICVKNKAVSARHARVYTHDPYGAPTDGYWVANGSNKATTALLLSAERGVRTMAPLFTHMSFKVGSDVQFELVRLAYQLRDRAAVSAQATHASVSEMFGAAESHGEPDEIIRSDFEHTGLDAATLSQSLDEAALLQAVSAGNLPASAPVTPASSALKMSGPKRVRFAVAEDNEGGCQPIGASVFQKAIEGKSSKHKDKTSYLVPNIKEDEQDLSHVMIMIATLRVVGGEQDGQEFSAVSRNGVVVIGSDHTCDIVVTGAEVSPLHARIIFTDSQNPQLARFIPIPSYPVDEQVEEVKTPHAPGAVGMSEASLPVDAGEVHAAHVCWIQDLSIGNKHGTQVIITSRPMALQRGDIVVLSQGVKGQPPPGTMITTSRAVSPQFMKSGLWSMGGSGNSTHSESQSSVGGSRPMLVSEGEVEASRRTRGTHNNAAMTTIPQPPRIELAVLFQSETSMSMSSWLTLCLRITRTRRSRRKSIHRTSSSRFPTSNVICTRNGATIGRSPACDVVIDDVTAANFHTQVVFAQDTFVLQTIADPDFFGTFILLGRQSAPQDQYRHESKGLYQLELNDVFRIGCTEFFVEEIKTENYADNARRVAGLAPLVKLLRRSPLFSLLPDLDLIRIANALQPVTANPGDILIEQGEAVDKDACFFVIDRGEVAVSVKRRDSDGSDVLNKLGPGQCFGEMALMADDRPRSATVACISPLTAYCLDFQSFRELLGPVMTAAMRLIAKKREASIRMQLLDTLFPSVIVSMTAEDIRDLTDAMVPVTFRRGQAIMRAGDDSTWLYLIVGGRVTVTSTLLPDALASVSLPDEYLTGSAIGELSLLLGEPVAQTMMAATNVAALGLDKEAFTRLLPSFGAWFSALWGHVPAVISNLTAQGIAVMPVMVNAAIDAAAHRKSVKGSTLDFDINDGQAVSGVMEVAAQQHARAKADKWQKKSVFHSSVSDINASAESLSESKIHAAEAGTPDAPLPAERRKSVIRVGESRRGSIQALPPDIGWEHRKDDGAARLKAALAGTPTSPDHGFAGDLIEESLDTHQSPAEAPTETAGPRRAHIRHNVRVPISSTAPSVEEVKLLARSPRFLILRALSGPHRGTYYYITADVTTLGGPNGPATIKLSDRTLSDSHAGIEYQDGAFWLRDLNSMTGTFLKLAAGKDYTLEMGDVFSIGHVELMVLGQPQRPGQEVKPPPQQCCTMF